MLVVDDAFLAGDGLVADDAIADDVVVDDVVVDDVVVDDVGVDDFEDAFGVRVDVDTALLQQIGDAFLMASRRIEQ